MQHIKKRKIFTHETALKQLISSGRVSIIYIHGTARSGSTIAEIIISQIADFAIHQPFRGILQKQGGRFRRQKAELDADIYDSACGLIAEQISSYLSDRGDRERVTVVIKELAGFFQPDIWQRWLKIPQQFLFTIRDPHLQYMSWLSAMTDKIFAGTGNLLGKNFVLEQAAITESSILPAEWEGTTIECNRLAWNAVVNDYERVKQAIVGTSKKLVVLDLILLRYKPRYALAQLFNKLDFPLEKWSQLDLNSLKDSQAKIQDIRDKSRPMVRKANNSKTIAPLVLGEAVNIDVFPEKSQAHIRQIIPLYLDLLYSSEQAYLPTLDEIDPSSKLIDTHPFVAYAIAIKHFQTENRLDFNSIDSWLNSIVASRTKSLAEDWRGFSSSLEIVNRYWKNQETNL